MEKIDLYAFSLIFTLMLIVPLPTATYVNNLNFEPLVFPKIDENNSSSRSGFTAQKPIVIEGDSDFEKYDFKGDGTKSNPYLIENFIIIGQSTAMYIKNTTKHFVIRNCKIRFCDIGIFIFNASDNTVIIANNSISYIADQNALGSVGQAILISETSYCTISNNTIFESDIAIFLSYCHHSKILNNSLSERYGVTIISSYYSIIANNSFNDCGLNFYGKPEIEEFTTYTVENNSLNGKLIGYFINSHDFTIIKDTFAQLIIVNCSMFTVSNQVLFDTTTGLSLYFCNQGKIENVTSFSNIFEGIAVYGSTDIILEKNYLQNNGFGFTGCGIRVRDSSNCTLIANICTENRGDGGILVVLAKDILISQNFCVDNKGEGIAVKTSISLNISFNNCSRNGIDGLSMLATNSSIIANNFIAKNSEMGIFAFDSNSNLFNHNTLVENADYGLSLMDAIADNRIRNTNNTVVYNFFIHNNLNGSSQAFDNGQDNIWYDKEAKKGNYWSDSNKRKYHIDGSADSVDKYPLNENLSRITFFFAVTPLLIVLWGTMLKRKEKRES
ncbi:MAG: NosD domain-containing protein [Candidatus Heimdallarchaeaceae archaeon]